MITFGDEILLGDQQLTGSGDPYAAALSDGRFFVGWTNLTIFLVPDDGEITAARGRFVNADGTTGGPEFLINDKVTSGQNVTSVAPLPDGAFVVTWTDGPNILPAPGTDLDVRFQVFDDTGARVGATPNPLAHGTLTDDQSNAVAVPFGDDFRIFFDTEFSDDIFDADLSFVNGDAELGTVFTPESIFADSDSFNNQLGDAVTLTDGRMVTITLLGLRGTIFTPQGTVETTFDTLPNEPGIRFAKLAALDNGNFVVVWEDTEDRGTDTEGSSVWGQLYQADGTPIGDNFQVNTTTAGIQSEIAVTGLPGGGFLVGWEDQSETFGDMQGIVLLGQQFDETGAKVDGEFEITELFGGNQRGIEFASKPNGDVLAVFSSEDNSIGGIAGDVHSRLLSFDLESDGGGDGNTPPVAENDDFTIGATDTLNESLFGDNGNGADSDADGDDFSITLVNGDMANVGGQFALPSGALLTVTSTGVLAYDPNGAFDDVDDGDTGTETFTYTITDEQGGTDTATVTIIVEGAPAPQAVSSDDLDGTNGFIITGAANADAAGFSVDGAGDLNDDGRNDLLIGARFADPADNNNAGEAYFLFTPEGGFPAAVSLDGLDGTTGVTLNGVTPLGIVGDDIAGVGDVNGDGIPDAFVLGYRFGDPNVGRSFIVFGDDDPFPAQIDLSDLDGSDGFALLTPTEGVFATDSIGAIGDINNDGVNDFAVGVSTADPGGRENAGQVFVVFGDDGGFPAAVDLSALDGTDGFAVNGRAAGDAIAFEELSIEGLGDINGDDIDDFVIGAPGDNTGGNDAGAVHVIFGSESAFGAALELSALNGTNGFTITGDVQFQALGQSVSGNGDVNNDGFNDLLISSANNVAYIIFGTDQGFAATSEIGAMGGPQTLALTNSANNVRFGIALLPDVSGDGIDDAAVSFIGGVQIVFGVDDDQDIPDTLDIGTLAEEDGITLMAPNAQFVRSAGDINGDGINDVIIGAPSEGANGTAYVFYGNGGDGGDGGEGNTAPVAQPDAFVTMESASVMGDLFADNGTGADSDADADAITVSEVNGAVATVGMQITLGSGALLTVQANGMFTYDPNGAFDGLNMGDADTDSFTYTISDGNGGSDTTTATITVTGEGMDGAGVNTPPVAADDAFATTESTNVTGDVLADNGNGVDSDADADTLSVTEVNSAAASVGMQIVLPSGALLTLQADGTFTYDPNGVFDALFNGGVDTDSFTYTLSDGNGGTDEGTATITVSGEGEPPVGNTAPDAREDLLSVGEDDTVMANLFADNGTGPDTDADADPLTVIQVNGVAASVGSTIAIGSGALLTVQSNGNVTYDPNNVFNALDDGDILTDIFTYAISDGEGGFDTASVAVTVLGSDDEPDPQMGEGLRGDGGDNVLLGTGFEEDLKGKDGNDLINAGDGDDRVLGGKGNDELDGEEGSDLLRGSKGRDTVRGGDDDDRLRGGEGDDELIGGAGDDNLFGGSGQDVLFGGTGDDVLRGRRDDDELYGQDGDDLLKGGNGDDILSGGAGNDILIGGKGEDIFVFGPGSDTERVTDFERKKDALDFSGWGALIDSRDEVEALATGDDKQTSIFVAGSNDLLVLEGLSIDDFFGLSDDQFIF